MKFNWTAISLAVGLIVPLLTWGVTVETRLSSTAKVEALTERIEQLETALLPVLIAYRVEETLRARITPPPAPSPKSAPKISFDDTKTRGDAERWARGQLPNVRQQAIER